MGVVLGALLGPEGMGVSLDLGRPVGRTSDRLQRMNRLVYGVGAGQGGTARSLRTAQWTRASLFSMSLWQVFKGKR